MNGWHVELPRIRASCASMGWNPKITLIVVGKRHHHRCVLFLIPDSRLFWHEPDQGFNELLSKSPLLPLLELANGIVDVQILMLLSRRQWYDL